MDKTVLIELVIGGIVFLLVLIGFILVFFKQKVDPEAQRKWTDPKYHE